MLGNRAALLLVLAVVEEAEAEAVYGTALALLEQVQATGKVVMVALTAWARMPLLAIQWPSEPVQPAVEGVAWDLEALREYFEILPLPIMLVEALAHQSPTVALPFQAVCQLNVDLD